MLFGDQDDRIRGYVDGLFAPEDDALSGWRARAEEAGLPLIQVSPSVGKTLQILVKAVGGRRALEIGTLGGYSGIWIARGLPEDGKLVTLEVESKHAEFARETFRRARVAEKIEIRLGPALESLPALQKEEPFDFIFIDADKTSYPEYLDWALKLARRGGIIAGDNALGGGFQGFIGDAEAESPNLRAMQTFNRRMATDPRLTSVILPMRDGVCIGVVG